MVQSWNHLQKNMTVTQKLKGVGVAAMSMQRLHNNCGWHAHLNLQQSMMNDDCLRLRT